VKLRAARRVGAAALVVAAAGACTEVVPPELVPTKPSTQAASRCVVGERSVGLARLEPWLGGRPFVLPVELVSVPGSSELYLAEMYGKIYRIDPASGAVRPVADLAGTNMNEGGLRGLAVHPSGARAFVVVERPAVETDGVVPIESELRSYALGADGTFDLASEQLVLRVHIPNGAHGMDTLRFGPDGKLYVSVGDGGTGSDHVPPYYDPTKLLGTVLRLDVDAGIPYAIPSDNPFVNVAGMRGEVYAYGFRNPWKFSFDRATGDLWAGDVGETRTEEVDRVMKGGNYGWPVLEGVECHPDAPGCSAAGTIAPVFSYTHAMGSAITGGFIYRGTRLPALAGKYVYADFQSGILWAVDLGVPGAVPAHLNKGEVRPMVAAIGEGADGELFALDWRGGVVYTLAPDGDAAERPPFASRLSETGCFDAADPKQPSPTLVPYDVNVELWSDGLRKQRFLALPESTSLDAMPDGTLALPKGGLAIKTFLDGTTPIETRFLGRQGDGEWVGASYVWNADGTDAVLVDEAKELTLASGHTWTVPGPGQCFFCHQASAGVSLGLVREQFDLENTRDDTTENQLARFARTAVVHGDVPTGPALDPSDGSAPVEARVRSYLHANCSGCHRPGTGIFSALDLRVDTSLTDSGLCGSCGKDCRFVTPGSPSTSRLSNRMHSRGPTHGYTDTQMPPIATRYVDPVGTNLIDEWVRSGPPCAGP